MTAHPITVLCVGDVFGEPGRRAIEILLPRIKKQHDVDLAVVNVENAAAGAGVTPAPAAEFSTLTTARSTSCCFRSRGSRTSTARRPGSPNTSPTQRTVIGRALTGRPRPRASRGSR